MLWAEFRCIPWHPSGGKEILGMIYFLVSVDEEEGIKLDDTNCAWSLLTWYCSPELYLVYVKMFQSPFVLKSQKSCTKSTRMEASKQSGPQRFWFFKVWGSLSKVTVQKKLPQRRNAPRLCWCRKKIWVLCACQWVERDLGTDVTWHTIWPEWWHGSHSWEGKINNSALEVILLPQLWKKGFKLDGKKLHGNTHYFQYLTVLIVTRSPISCVL